MISAIAPLTVMVLTAITARALTRSWLSPGAFFPLLWSFFVFVPLVFAPDFNADAFGLWYIVLLAMACAAGSVIIPQPAVTKFLSLSAIGKNANLRLLFLSYNLFLLVTLVGLVLLIFYAFSNYGLKFNTAALLSIPNLISVDRYSGSGAAYPLYVRYSLYCIYPASLLGGFLRSLTPAGGKKFLSVLPIIVAIIFGMVQGTRSNILLTLVLYFSAFFSGLITNQNETVKISYLKVIISGSIAVAVFTVFYIVIQWLRQGMDPFIVELLLTRIRAYFFGYLASFTQWVSHLDSVLPTLGLTTFAGPSNLADIIERPLGFYDAHFIAPGITTNIYSALRGLILDFSLLGSVVVAFILGFLIQLAFLRVRYGSLLAMVPLSMFYAFTLYSPVISIFHYNSIIISWVFAFIVFLPARHAILAYNR